MKKNLGKYIKIFSIILCSLIVHFIIFCIVSIIIFENMNIEDIDEKYDIEIPMGSFDAKYGSGEKILYNDKIKIYTLYYTKKLDYLIKKYNFKNINHNDQLLNDLTEKITNNLSSENKEVVQKYLSKDFQNIYYKFIENKNGKILLFYDNNSQTIYCIENILKN